MRHNFGVLSAKPSQARICGSNTHTQREDLILFFRVVLLLFFWLNNKLVIFFWEHGKRDLTDFQHTRPLAYNLGIITREQKLHHLPTASVWLIVAKRRFAHFFHDEPRSILKGLVSISVMSPTLARANFANIILCRKLVNFVSLMNMGYKSLRLIKFTVGWWVALFMPRIKFNWLWKFTTIHRWRGAFHMY